jgi:ankyrin repeat protein
MSKPIPSAQDANNFRIAAAKGDIATLESYLDKFGAVIVNTKNTLQDTALSAAASWGRDETVKWLLERGADVDGQGPDGGTALLWAASAGRTEAVRLLLERGADPELRDRQGQTPLKLAKLCEHPEVVVWLELFIEHKKKLLEDQRRQAERKAEAAAAQLRQEQLKSLRPTKPALKKKQPKP